MNKRTNEHGYVIIWLAISLVTLLILAAFVVDVGNWYLIRDRAQKAADAAAIAAVAFLPDDRPGACDAAQEEAERHGFELFDSDPTSPTGRDNCGASGNPVQFASADTVRVAVSKGTGVFFAQFAGLGGQTIRRSAAAQYAGPVLMGSPSNVLGNEPIRTNSAGSWVTTNASCSAAQRSATPTPNRNPGTPQRGFMPPLGTNNQRAEADAEWRPCFDDGGGFWLMSTGPLTDESNGDDTPGGVRRYIIETVRQTAGLGPLAIEIYDPMTYLVGLACHDRNAQGSGTRRLAATATPTRVEAVNVHTSPVTFDARATGNDWGRFAEANDRHCNGDDALGATCGGGDGGGGTSGASMTRDVPILLAQTTASDCILPSTQISVIGNDGNLVPNAECTQPSSGSAATGYAGLANGNPRTYVAQTQRSGVFMPGQSFMGNQKNFMDFADGIRWFNDGSVEVNGIVYGGHADFRGYTDAAWNNTVRQWNRICTIPDPGVGTHRYEVAIQSTEGRGMNNFSIRAAFIDATTGVRYNPDDTTNYVQVYAKGALPMYMNLRNGTLTLAKITTAYAGKNLLITFFDPGDSTNDPDNPATGYDGAGTFTIRPPAEATAGGLAMTTWTCDWHVVQPNGSPAATHPADEGPSAPAIKVEDDPSDSECAIPIPRNYMNGVPPGDPDRYETYTMVNGALVRRVYPQPRGWNNHKVYASIAIPDDYVCDPVDRTDCWVSVVISGINNPLTDATVWTAEVDGDPIRLVE